MRYSWIIFWIISVVHAILNDTVLLNDKNRIFVETGCYLGDGVMKAVNAGYEYIFSIELSEMYARICRIRFRRHLQVTVVLGDSATELKKLISKINEPTTFWLDGHFSAGDTAKGEKNSPLMEELSAIGDHFLKTHTIMIDDIRLTANVTVHAENNQFDDLSLYAIIRKVMSINPRYSLSFVDGLAPNDILLARMPDPAVVCSCGSDVEVTVNTDGSLHFPSLPLPPQRHVTAALHGDMGEQMFIIAATISYAWRNNLTFNFEPSHLRDEIYTTLLQDRRGSLAEANASQEEGRMLFVENAVKYDTLPVHPQKNVRLIGRFQNYLYFDADYLQISDYFQWALVPWMNTFFLKHLKSVLAYAAGQRLACVEYPFRVDFEDGSLHPQLPVSYYQRAVQYIDSVHNGSVVYVIFLNADVGVDQVFGFMEESRQVRVLYDMHHALRFMLMSSFDGGAVLSEDSALGWWGAYVMDHARTLPIVVPRGSYAAAGEEGSTEKRMLPHWIEM